MSQLKKASILTLFIFILSGCSSQPLTLKEQFKPKNLSADELQASCLSGLTGACSLLGKGSEPGQKHGILQGPSSETETTLVVLRKDSEKLIYAYRQVGSTSLQAWSYPLFQTRERSFSEYEVDHIRITDLKPHQHYEFLVIEDNGMVKDQRFFRGLDSKKKNPKISIASCMDDSLKDVAHQIWPQFLSHKPDLVLLIGDNVYADKYTVNFGNANPEIIWNRYVETRQALPLFFAKDLIPVMATWDDHDYGKNSGDRTYEHREGARQVFFDFFPQEYKVKNFSRGSGVSNSLVAFNVQLVLLDSRFDRSPNRLKVADETHFGRENEQWLYKQMRSHSVPTFLIEGDQFFGGYHNYESYEGNHPNSFKTFLSKLKTFSQPVLFVSGDRHHTEIIKPPLSALGYQTYELTSSAIHSTRYANSFIKSPSPNKLVGVAGEYNYMTVDLKKVEKKSITILVESFGLNNKKFYSQTLNIKK